MYVKDRHCSYCGARFPHGAGWPRLCMICKHVSYRNPLPVVIVLVPVVMASGTGVLLIKRGIAPQAGRYALPGGYIESGENWQDAAVRELYEEANVEIDPAGLTVRDVFSAPDDTLILATQSAPIAAAALGAFTPSEESVARDVVLDPIELAFPFHTQMVREFLADGTAGR